MELLFSYVIGDVVAEKFSPPFFAENEAVAIRQYGMLMKELAPHIRNDYQLWRTGSFNIKTGETTVLIPMVLILTGEGVPDESVQ